MSRLSLIARSAFLIGFVVAMPLLALPSVSRQLDELLYGKSKDNAPLDGIDSHGGGSAEQDDVAQATFVTPLEESLLPPDGRITKRGLDAADAAPPALAALPSFSIVQPEVAAPADTSQPMRPQRPEPGPATNGRIDEIRQELEDLGAEYVVLEVVDDEAQYHFLCKMLVESQSAETEIFEASGKNAVGVAEQVLKSVRMWRASQTFPPR